VILVTTPWPVASRVVTPGPGEARIWSADLDRGPRPSTIWVPY
jgi:hypothetical protein